MQKERVFGEKGKIWSLYVRMNMTLTCQGLRTHIHLSGLANHIDYPRLAYNVCQMITKASTIQLSPACHQSHYLLTELF